MKRLNLFLLRDFFTIYKDPNSIKRNLVRTQADPPGRKVILRLKCPCFSLCLCASVVIFAFFLLPRISFAEGESEVKLKEKEDAMPLVETVLGVETARSLKLKEIIDKVSEKKIIYVGEEHDKYEHHLTQLEVAKGLFARNRKITIGMEMFQKPFQKVLDNYINGEIEEREFLKSSEYFKRWIFDYNLYKDILRFAREEKIPVIALNIRKEITEKVSKKGIDSLTEEEKKDLPDSMDMTDEEYRRWLEEVFEKHEGFEGRDFAKFYQAQILWDETMAQSIDEYLKRDPDRQMVVIAGGGHLAFGSGIPKRAFRRNGFGYSIILNDEAVEEKIADFILFPKAAKMESSPKLMVLLKEEEAKVRITGFSAKSVAEKAGLKEDDIILSLDGEAVNGVDDVKIFLFYKKPGDTIKVIVLRKRFLFGEREMVFDITL